METKDEKALVSSEVVRLNGHLILKFWKNAEAWKGSDAGKPFNPFAILRASSESRRREVPFRFKSS
jgi:hypothetical protein